MICVFLNEYRHFLNGSNNDFCVGVTKLPRQNGRRGITVGRALFETVILLHGLIVQVLTVYHEQHLADIRQVCDKLGRFETGQGLAGAGGMENVSTALHCTISLVVGGDFNAVKNTLRSNDLIGAHHQQEFFRRKNAILGQDIQYRCLGKKRLGEVHQVGDNTILGVRPKRCKLKAVAGLAALSRRRRVEILDMPQAGRVGVIFCVRSVGDNKNLHIVEQAAARPKAVALVAVDLIECLADSYPATLQLHMNQRQSVDENGHIVTVIVGSALCLRNGILVDDLQRIVVNTLFIKEANVF